MFHTLEGSVLYVRAKFEVDNSIRSKVIRATLTYGSLYGPYAGGVRPLRLYQADSSILSKVKGGPKIWKLCHVTQAMPT